MFGNSSLQGDFHFYIIFLSICCRHHGNAGDEEFSKSFRPRVSKILRDKLYELVFLAGHHHQNYADLAVEGITL